LPPLHRLVLVLSQTFHWSDHRIFGFLESEGKGVSRETVPEMRSEAYQSLYETLPEDVQAIYLPSAISTGLTPQPQENL
jgi:hypothetical protein